MNAMETTTYINIIILGIFALYYSETKSKMDIVITLSIGITLVQLLAVILYHTYTYANIKILSRIQNSSGYKKLKKMLPSEHIHYPNHQPPADLYTDINNQIIELLDKTDGSDSASQTSPGEPTYSVVEIAHPHLATPPPPTEKVTEEADSEAQQQNNKQKDVPVPKAEDSQSAAQVSNADIKCTSGDIGSSSTEIQ